MIGVGGKNCMGQLYMMFVRMKVITKSILFKSVGDERERERERERDEEVMVVGRCIRKASERLWT